MEKYMHNSILCLNLESYLRYKDHIPRRIRFSFNRRLEKKQTFVLDNSAKFDDRKENLKQ